MKSPKKTTISKTRTKWSSEPPWLFDGKPIDLSVDHPYAGFVYRIVDTETGVSYIGKKSLISKRIKTFKTGRKRRRVVSESDWRRYWSSSDEVKAFVLQHGFARFRREILVLCTKKKMVSFWEEKLLWSFRVLESGNFFNSNIGGRFFKASTDDLANCKVAHDLLDKTSTLATR